MTKSGRGNFASWPKGWAGSTYIWAGVANMCLPAANQQTEKSTSCPAYQLNQVSQKYEMCSSENLAKNLIWAEAEAETEVEVELRAGSWQ